MKSDFKLNFLIHFYKNIAFRTFFISTFTFIISHSSLTKAYVWHQIFSIKTLHNDMVHLRVVFQAEHHLNGPSRYIEHIAYHDQLQALVREKYH